MSPTTHALIQAYYDRFNAGDRSGFLALLTDDVSHDVNQGGRETGRDAFGRFYDHMETCYSERISDLVIMTDVSGSRAAAEFVVHGTYRSTDSGLPEADGQTYVLPAGAFFEVRGEKIARISNTYNLNDWLRQVTREQ